MAPAARAQTDPNRAELITNGPQANPGDRSGARSAAQNVRDSHNYESTVHANPGYRAVREQKECGPIDRKAARGLSRDLRQIALPRSERALGPAPQYQKYDGTP